MKVDYLLLAEASQMLPDGRMNLLGAGIQNVPAQEANPPWTIRPLDLILCLVVTAEERGRPIRFSAELVTASGESVPDFQAESTQILPPIEDAEEVGRLAMQIQTVGITVPAPGIYYFVIRVLDLETESRLEARVRLRVVAPPVPVGQEQSPEAVAR